MFSFGSQGAFLSFVLKTMIEESAQLVLERVGLDMNQPFHAIV